MSSKDDAFKKLQNDWYTRLADAGFEDIERRIGERSVLIEPCFSFFRNTDEFRKNMQEEYFRLIGHKVNDETTTFRTEVDRYVLNRHAEGANIKTIVLELASKGDARNRKTVCMIIRKYVVAWKLRIY